MRNVQRVAGRLRGATDARQVIEGTDDKYLHAAGLGRLSVPFDAKGWPMKQRVGRHAASVVAILAAFTSAHPEKPISLNGLPSYADLMANGLKPSLLREPESDADAKRPRTAVLAEEA